MEKTFAILLCFLGLVLGCDRSHFKVEKTIMNPYDKNPLKLVARYDAARIYVYADISSTNEIPDYVVMQGYEPIVWNRNTSSNTVNLDLMERNFQGMLETTYGQNSKIQKRWIMFTDTNRMFKFYSDTNADGLWDRYIDGEQKKTYVRSNSSWIPLYPTNAPQAH